MILFIVFSLIFAKGDDCGKRTKVYTAHGKSNDYGFYFVPVTYIGRDLNYACVKNDEGGNTKFKNTIEQRFPCNYQHCVPGAKTGNWGCTSSNYTGTSECYHTEHIIPDKHEIKELVNKSGERCDVNVYGNLVMAYGSWNSALGNGHYDEKKEIYGELFNSAYKAVYYCCNDRTYPQSIPVPNCEPTVQPTINPVLTTKPAPVYSYADENKTEIFYFAISTAVILIIILFVIVGVLILELKKSQNSEKTIESEFETSEEV
jgi:hypothetical protein